MATNDLADLNSKLTTQLRDTGSTLVWASSEKDYLIQQAVDTLWPRFSRPLDPESTTITLVDNDPYYALPSGVMAVSRLDIIDTNGDFVDSVPDRAWEIVGDTRAGTGKLHINQRYAVTGNTLQLHGYGAYDTVTNLVPTHDLAQLVLARARAEAYRRVASDREKFKAWLSRNQVQNVTVNELLELINEADAEANRLTAMVPKTWQKPVSAYTG